MSDELIQRDKVVLMSDLNKSKGDVSQIQIAVQFFTRNMKVLIAENDQLKKANTTLTAQRDSTLC
jgi:hypothetical protein